MSQSSLFQSGDENVWEPAGEGVSRQVLGFGDNLMLVKVKFAKGARGVLHSHRHVQASFVESGIFEMTIGVDVKILRKGDGYYIPPYAVHGCVCLEDGMLVDAFSPARTEFLSDNDNG
ncbi:MAG: cupin domain-containing protein [Mucilaginibacter sp.]